MFPPDKQFKETYRVLKPGGTMHDVVCVDFPSHLFCCEIMNYVLGQTPPKHEKDPLALAEPGLFESLVATYFGSDKLTHLV
jgi:ubiquinone/menaquinone biosynthesis C-methylase UbiE